MSEVHVAEALLRFHLGASDDAERDRVDAHLLDCRACLGGYLALKRQFDSAGAFDERPSPATRERLRKDVRRRLPAALARPRVWAVGAALAAALLVLFWIRAQHAEIGNTRPGTLIDTGQEVPVAQVM